MRTPRAVSTSALPLRLVEARAPCLAMAHPAAAMTKEAALETLKVLMRAGASSCGVQQIGGNFDGQHALVERVGKAGQLIGTFALGNQQGKGRSDLGIRGFGGQHGTDQLRGLRAGKVARRQQGGKQLTQDACDR